MSYILEALRKSEGERSTGQIPGLAAQHELTSEGLDERRPLWPWVLSLVMAANVGLMAYVLWPRLVPAVVEAAPAHAAATPAEPAGKPAATEPASAAAASGTDAPVTPVASTGTPASPPATGPTPPASYPPGAQPVYIQTGPGQAPVAYVPASAVPPGYVQPVYVQSQAPAGYGYPAQAGYAQQQPYAAGAYPQAGYAQPGYAPAQAAPVYPAQAYGQASYPPPAYGNGYGPSQAPGETLPELADGETLITPQGVQTQDANAVPNLTQLPQAFQNLVPPMSFSTHVYSSNPSKSFVVINGQTYAPGAQVYQGFLLEAIVEDGVVFNHLGQRFKMDALKNWPES